MATFYKQCGQVAGVKFSLDFTCQNYSIGIIFDRVIQKNNTVGKFFETYAVDNTNCRSGRSYLEYRDFSVIYAHVKGKGSPYSITERRVPELIPVLGSQPAGDVSHKPGGRHPLLSARPAVTLATLNRAATNFAANW